MGKLGKTRLKMFYQRSNLVILLVTVGLASSALPARAGGAPVCDQVLEKSRNYPGAEFLSEMRKTFSSCAPWLARACLSPFRLDVKNPVSDLIEGSRPLNAQSCSESKGNLTAGSFNCFRKDTEALTSSSRESVNGVIDTLNASMDRYPRKIYQAEVVRLALEQWKSVNEKRDHDLEIITSLYEKESLKKSLSVTDVKAAIGTLKTRVKAAADRSGTHEKALWYEFVADQIAEAAEDETVDWKDDKGVSRRDVVEGIYTRMGSENSDSSRFKELVTRAKQVDTGDDLQFDGNLTPYHSKMILLYNLENRLREKYKSDPKKADAALDALASKLVLKADFTSKGTATQWKAIIPHDGFVLGASLSQVENLTQKSSSVAEKGPGTGVDCATFVQQILIKAGYDSLRSGGRMTTAEAEKGGRLSSFAQLDPMAYDAIYKLAPGDLIVKREEGETMGHIQIVVGYENDPPQLVVVSAEGGYERSLVRRTIDIFPNQPKSCTRNNYFSEESEKMYYRASLVKEPK